MGGGRYHEADPVKNLLGPTDALTAACRNLWRKLIDGSQPLSPEDRRYMIAQLTFMQRLEAQLPRVIDDEEGPPEVVGRD